MKYDCQYTQVFKCNPELRILTPTQNLRLRELDFFWGSEDPQKEAIRFITFTSEQRTPNRTAAVVTPRVLTTSNGRLLLVFASPYFLVGRPLTL